MSDNLIAVIVIFSLLLVLIPFFYFMYRLDKNDEILAKYPQYKELFKIKAFKKAFFKKYKLLKSKEYYVGLIDSMNKDIDILDVEMSIYKKSYKNYNNNGYRRFEYE